MKKDFVKSKTKVKMHINYLSKGFDMKLGRTKSWIGVYMSGIQE